MLFKMYSFKQKFIGYEKKEESMAYTQNKRKSIETALEKILMMDLLDKIFKSAIINVFKELKKLCLRSQKDIRKTFYQTENINKDILLKGI